MRGEICVLHCNSDSARFEPVAPVEGRGGMVLAPLQAMHKLLIASGALLGALAPVVQGTAMAQTAAATSPAVPPADESVTPRVTVRLHAGPSLNLMSDWRNGLNTLWDMTEARGLSPRDKSCICMSWGSTVLVH